MKRKLVALTATVVTCGVLASSAAASVLSNLQTEIASYNGIAKTAVWVEANGGNYLSGICSSHLKVYGAMHYSNGNTEWSYTGGYWSGGLGWNIQHWTYSRYTCDPRYYSGIYGF